MPHVPIDDVAVDQLFYKAGIPVSGLTNRDARRKHVEDQLRGGAAMKGREKEIARLIRRLDKSIKRRADMISYLEKSRAVLEGELQSIRKKADA